jgi:hypothetical protein
MLIVGGKHFALKQLLTDAATPAHHIGLALGALNSSSAVAPLSALLHPTLVPPPRREQARLGSLYRF